MTAPSFRLCLLLTRELCSRDPLEVLRESVAGGVDCVQIREKEMNSDQLYLWGCTVRDVCQELNVPLILNDDVEIAAALGVEGVHLGQEDMSVADARAILNEGQWIGISTHDLEQLDAAADSGADYAGFGPVFPTALKADIGCLPADATTQAAVMKRLPVVAIGGISPANMERIPSQLGLAVCTAICAADDPQAVAKGLSQR